MISKFCLQIIIILIQIKNLKLSLIRTLFNNLFLFSCSRAEYNTSIVIFLENESSY